MKKSRLLLLLLFLFGTVICAALALNPAMWKARSRQTSAVSAPVTEPVKVIDVYPDAEKTELKENLNSFNAETGHDMTTDEAGFTVLDMMDLENDYQGIPMVGYLMLLEKDEGIARLIVSDREIASALADETMITREDGELRAYLTEDTISFVCWQEGSEYFLLQPDTKMDNAEVINFCSAVRVSLGKNP